MTFLYPLGLLGLIGIPILILVYIIKSKYTEQTVASTYLWTLSQRFMKRRNPISKLTGIIALILQLLAITLLSFIIAHPVFTIKNSAREYCFILDGSASMCTESEGVTRFEEGKEEIKKIISETTDGSRYTLIHIGEVTSVVYEKLDSKDQAISLLSSVEPTHLHLDSESAIEKAQKYFDANPSTVTYLVTDRGYLAHDNVELINLGKGEVNVGVSDVVCTELDGQVIVDGVVERYTGEGNVTLKLYVNDLAEPSASLKLGVPVGEPQRFSLVAELEGGYDSVRVEIEDGDANPLDDVCVIYNTDADRARSILLVSDSPFFLESALESITSKEIKVLPTKSYSANTKGYGLYIFHNYTPTRLPTDGAVWQVNPRGSVSGSGFAVREEETLISPDMLTLSGSTASTVVELTSGVEASEIYITKYTKCGLNGNFYNLLNYQSDPVIFAGVTDNGNRQAVFAFDIQNSNIALLPDFIMLLDNLLDYSFPPVLDTANVTAGEKIKINTLPGIEALSVTAPSGEVFYLPTNVALNEFVPAEVGTYTISMLVGSGERVYNFFSEMPGEERNTAMTEEGAYRLAGTASSKGTDGIYDDLMFFMIALSLIFIADWMVYCYEKYQLR